MKDTVIEIINCECPDVEKFNKLFAIYNSHPQKNSNIAFNVNMQGYKPAALQTIVHELKKLYEIQDLEIHIAATEKGPCTNCGRNAIQPATFQIEPVQQTNPNPEEPVDLVPQNAEEFKESEGKKFREDYPFLSDPNCPEEFKILAADKISAHYRVVKGREVLADASRGENDLSEEDLALVAKDVADSDELNSLIHEEFEHYKTSGEVLGKHPIFITRVMQKEIDLMTGPDKVKALKNLDSDIRREKAKIEKATAENDLEEVEKVESRLKTKLIKQSLLNKSIQ